MVTTVITDVVFTLILLQCNIRKEPKYVDEDFVIECLMKSDKVFVDSVNAEVAKWANELLQKAEVAEDKINRIVRYDCEMAKADYVFTFLGGVRCIIYWKEKEEVV